MIRRAVVIGAGLAGSSAAQRLAARGWTIDLIDYADGPGRGASGNRMGVLRPQPSLDDNRLSRLTRTAFRYTRRHCESLAALDLPLRWGPTGVLHLARDARHAIAQQRVVDVQQPDAGYLRYVDRQQAGVLAGWPVDSGGWWFPGGAWVDPASLCRANIAHAAAALRTHFRGHVARIERRGENWCADDADGGVIAEAPVLILANAAEAKRFAAAAHLPLRSARGQVSHLRGDAGSAPEIVVCRQGYVTPAVDGLRCVGATFGVDDEDATLREADHAENLAKLQSILPGYTDNIALASPSGRVGFRPLAPDRLPMIGAIADAAAIDPTHPSRPLAAIPRVKGLYLIDGFGSRGIVWSAFAGELLACLITGSPLPLDEDLRGAVDPARFLLRAWGQRLRQPLPA